MYCVSNLAKMRAARRMRRSFTSLNRRRIRSTFILPTLLVFSMNEIRSNGKTEMTSMGNQPLR